MRRIQNIAIMLSTALVLVSCSEEQPQDVSTFVEYAKVEGACYGNHVKVLAPYSGFVVHWYNETKDQHSRYGFVYHKESALLDPDKYDPDRFIESIQEKVKHPYRYYPLLSAPFSQFLKYFS